MAELSKKETLLAARMARVFIELDESSGGVEDSFQMSPKEVDAFLNRLKEYINEQRASARLYITSDVSLLEMLPRWKMKSSSHPIPTSLSILPIGQPKAMVSWARQQGMIIVSAISNQWLADLVSKQLDLTLPVSAGEVELLDTDIALIGTSSSPEATSWSWVAVLYQDSLTAGEEALHQMFK